MKAKDLIKILEQEPEAEVLTASTLAEQSGALKGATATYRRMGEADRHYTDAISNREYVTTVWVGRAVDERLVPVFVIHDVDDSADHRYTEDD